MSELRVNRIVPKDGLPAGASGGGIIQLTYGNTSSQIDVSTTSSWVQVYTSIASIKPASSSNKVLIDMRTGWYQPGPASGEDYFDLRFTRTIGGTTTAITEYVPGYNGWYDTNTTLSPMSNNHFQYLDSPATTSTISYGFQVYVRGLQSTALMFSYDDGGGHQYTSMTLMEVSG